MLTRRETLALGGGALAAMMLVPLGAHADVASAAEDIIADFTGGAATEEGGLVLDITDLAPNGASVPVEVSAPGAVAIMLVGPGNRQPEMFTASFGPLSGSQRLNTRIRLAQSQRMVAVARMEDGSFRRATAQVAVTVGGCVA